MFDSLPRAQLGPAPGGGPLTFEVPCTADPIALGERTHPVTIGPDWSLHTPHDLAAERVVAALGGYSSCVELVERVVPAARRRLQVLARLVPVGLVRAGAGWRLTDPVAGCCRTATGGTVFRDAARAGEHRRSNRHHALAAACRGDLLEVVVRALVRAHTGGSRFPIPTADLAEAEPLVAGPAGAARLWDAGVHPRLVVALHRAVAADGPPLPPVFYLGAFSRGQDPAWLRRCLAGVQRDDADEPAGLTGELAEWLAWTDTELDRADPFARSEYLRMGLPLHQVMDLSRAGVPPAGVRRLSRATGLGPAFSAAQLLDWVAAGAAPDVAAIAAVYELGAPPTFRPSEAMLARMRAELGPTSRRVQALDLLGLVALAGTVPDAVAAFHRGALDPHALAGEARSEERPSGGMRVRT